MGEVDPSSKVTLSSEHQAFVWLPYEQALEKLTYDNAKAILQKAHRFILLLIN